MMASTADLVTVAPGDVYHVRLSRAGRVVRARGFRSAIVPVHRPTDRVIYQVASPGVLRLGPSVADFVALGFARTTLESEAGR